MKVTFNLFEFASIVGFWGGAQAVWNSLTDDKKNYINEYLEDSDATFDSMAEVNDFMRFVVPDILKEENED